MSEEIKKIKFKSCLLPEPKNIKFIGLDDEYIGTVKLKPLTRKEVESLVEAKAEDWFLASIIEWDFKENGQILDLTKENIDRLNFEIITEISKAIADLNFVSGAEEKN